MLSRYMRQECMNHSYVYDQPLPTSRLVTRLADSEPAPAGSLRSVINPVRSCLANRVSDRYAALGKEAIRRGPSHHRLRCQSSIQRAHANLRASGSFLSCAAG